MIQHLSRWQRFLHLVGMATFIAWVFSTVTTLRIIDQPFPAFLVEPNMLVSTLRLPDWSGETAGIRTYDRLLSANGQPLESTADLDRLVSSLPAGTPITYQVARKDERLLVTVPTRTFQRGDYLRLILPWQLSGIAFLLTGLIAFWLRSRHPAAQAHLLFTATFALFASYFTVYVTTHQFGRLYLCGIYLLGATFLHLALSFPAPHLWLGRHPWRQLLAYLPALAIMAPLYCLYRPLGFSATPQQVDLHFAQLTVWSVWTAFGGLFFMGRCAHSAWRGQSAQARSQAGVVLVGALAAFVPALLAYIVPQLLGQVGSVPTWMSITEMACFHLFPLSVAYAIIRHQLFDIRLVIRRATLYAAVITGLAVLYLGVAGIGYAVLGKLFPIQGGPSLPGFIAALTVAVAFRPLHDHLRRGIDRLFLGERANALQVLAHFSQMASSDEPTLAKELLAIIEQALQPRWICLVLADQTQYAFGVVPSYVAGARLPATKTGLHSLRTHLPEAEDQALALSLQVSSDRQHSLLIGPASSEMPYNSDEHAMLRALAGQAAIAFQNAHLLEERIQLLVQEGLSRHAATERKQLLMQIVHDVKSDLFNIALALHLAKNKADRPDALDSIQRSMERIDALLNEKVTVIKEGRGQGITPLLPALEEAMATLSPQIAQKEQWLEFQGPEADCQAPLSPIELKQVVVNLLSNASKFSPSGTAICLEAQVTAGNVVLKVSDQGPGVPPGFLEDLGSGKRADASIPGSGLGLLNVKAIVEAIGGTLSCHNHPIGATFVLQIPHVREVRTP